MRRKKGAFVLIIKCGLVGKVNCMYEQWDYFQYICWAKRQKGSNYLGGFWLYPFLYFSTWFLVWGHSPTRKKKKQRKKHPSRPHVLLGKVNHVYEQWAYGG
mmetsp:Transcript_50709/g.93748  ORF Transcript_50709/g.93748 Transcript_50709/m.93748 type:complete len:101 (-) Transcript_50709:233-535(-)